MKAKQETSTKQAVRREEEVCLLFDTEDGDDMFLRNIG
jgi:hypothetical protein